MTVSSLEHEKIPNSGKKEFRIKGPKKLFWEAIVGGPFTQEGRGGGTNWFIGTLHIIIVYYWASQLQYSVSMYVLENIFPNSMWTHQQKNLLSGLFGLFHIISLLLSGHLSYQDTPLLYQDHLSLINLRYLSL